MRNGVLFVATGAGYRQLAARAAASAPVHLVGATLADRSAETTALQAGCGRRSPGSIGNASEMATAPKASRPEPTYIQP